eukprot:scaffold40355_cov204-Skeletonema_marinoi.AAC.1
MVQLMLKTGKEADAQNEYWGSMNTGIKKKKLRDRFRRSSFDSDHASSITSAPSERSGVSSQTDGNDMHDRRPSVEGVSPVTSASDYQRRRRCRGVPQCNVMFLNSSVLHSLISSALHFRQSASFFATSPCQTKAGFILDIAAMLRKNGIFCALSSFHRRFSSPPPPYKL